MWSTLLGALVKKCRFPGPTSRNSYVADLVNVLYFQELASPLGPTEDTPGVQSHH